MSQKCLQILLIFTCGLLSSEARDVTRASREPARLQVELRDKDSGRLIPARLYLTDAQGAPITPPGLIAYEKRDERHFIAPGSFEMELAPGSYSLLAERGPEYLSATSSLEVSAGQTRKEVLQLERWIEMNGRGWYSGDLHNHRKVEEMPELLLAEDLNFAPTLSDWIWEDRTISKPPETAEAVRSVDAHHCFSVLDKEVERLESGPGAVALIGLKSAIPFEGYRLYPPNSVYCEAAHAQGAYVDAEKILWRDVAALAALGHIDFAGIVHNHFNRHDVELETDRWGMIPKHRPEFNTVAGMPLWSMDVYYRLLNCGFRLPVSAGSASGVKASPLGYNRVYVKLAGAFGYREWLETLKAGRSFATNGPMLFFAVNGAEPGLTVRPTGGAGRLRIRAEALSPRRLERLEILFRGRVIKTVASQGSGGRLSAEFETTVSQPGWFAARCFEPAGRTIRFAHTSPVYVEVGARRQKSSEDARFFVQWLERELEFYRKTDGFREARHREEMLAFFQRARAVYIALAAQ